MPPKGKHAKAPPKGKPGAKGQAKQAKKKDGDDDEALVAVVMADSFNERMLPLTAERPRALLPLLGVPLLDWTLETLSMAAVEHTYILARTYTEQIRAHVAGRKRVSVLPIPSAMSVGDAMRELDNAKVIKNDFLLVHADGVGNLDLDEVVRIHKERRKADKDCILTMCTMGASGDSTRRPPGDRSLLVTNPLTHELVHYEPVPAVPRKTAMVLPVSLFDPKEGQPDIELRNDLVDCGVDVCSVDVPPLFTENFDYQELRRDFVPGILTSEILTAKIFLHIASASPLGTAAPESVLQRPPVPWDPRIGRGWGYHMRVRDTKSYDVVAKDIVGKWVAPLGPGGYLPAQAGTGLAFTAYPASRYQAPGVHLNLSSEIGRATVLGARARVGKHTFISHSILGDDTHVGDGCRITHSYLWSGVHVADHVSMDRVIIGDNVRIGSRVTLGRGCVVADGCVIGDGVALPPFTRIGRLSYDAWLTRSGASASASASASSAQEPASALLGTGAVGHIWSMHAAEESDEEEEEDPIEAWANAMYLQIGRASPSVSEVGDEDDDDLSSLDGDSELASSSADDLSDSSSVITDAVGGEKAALTVTEGQATAAEVKAEVSKINDFYQEALASLQRAAKEGHRKENVAIELSTLRMASNVEQRELVAVVFTWLLQQASKPDLRELGALLTRWGSILATVGAGEEACAISAMQTFCAATDGYRALFGPLLTGCYNVRLPGDSDGAHEQHGIVTEDGLIAWYKSRASSTADDAVERILALPVRLAGAGDEAHRVPEAAVLQLRAQGREVLESILAESDSDSQSESESDEDEDESD